MVLLFRHRSNPDGERWYSPSAIFVVSVCPSAWVYVVNEVIGVHCVVLCSVSVLMRFVLSLALVGVVSFVRCELHLVHAIDCGDSASVAEIRIGRSGNCESVSGGSVHARAIARKIDIFCGSLHGSPPFAHWNFP